MKSVFKSMKNSPLEDIPSGAHKMRMMPGDVKESIEAGYKRGREALHRNIKKIEIRVNDISSKIEIDHRGKEMAKKNILLYEKRINDIKSGRTKGEYTPDQIMDMEDNLAKQRDDLVFLEERLSKKMGKEQKLRKRKKVLSKLHADSIDNPQKLIREIESNPKLIERYPSLGAWKSSIIDSAERKDLIFNAVSRNLNNDNAFLREYLLRVKPFEKDKGGYAANWILNPENQRKLNTMSEHPSYSKYIRLAQTPAGLEKAITSINRKFFTKALAIPASLAGAAAFMGWFRNNEEEVVSSSRKTKATLGSLNVSGAGRVIKEQTNHAINNIENAVLSTNSNLKKSPNDSGRINGLLVDTIVKNKAVIDKNLKRWSIVVRNSSDNTSAEAIGRDIEAYSGGLTLQLKEIGMAVSAGSVQTNSGSSVNKTHNTKKIPRDHIRSVQSYLSSLFPNVGPTGNLDRPTMRALRSLEQKYDKLGNTKKFTTSRLLVRPNDGHLIDLNDLRKLDQVMRKY